MERMKLWMLAAILFCGAGCLTSCSGSATTEKTDENTEAVEKVGDPLAAVEKYLMDSIGAQYSPGELCVPCYTVVSQDTTNTDSVSVLGDFWVFNYKVVGDTLKTVSGGSHPGLMILQKNENGEYMVASFDQVEDGAGNLESAKRIFGDVFEAFQQINSDEKSREQVRGLSIAKYVKEHNLPVKYYQDFGWDAKEIPAE